MGVGLGTQMTDQGRNGNLEHAGKTREKRRLMLTQLLRSPVLNPAGAEVGRVEDFIVKLAEGGGYPPITGLKVRVGAQDVFVGIDLVDKLEPGAMRLNTHTIQTQPFQRRPGEVLLASDVLGRHLVDVARGRIVQAHDLVIAHGEEGWRLQGIDRSPQAMLRRLVPRRGRPYATTSSPPSPGRTSLTQTSALEPPGTDDGAVIRTSVGAGPSARARPASGRSRAGTTASAATRQVRLGMRTSRTPTRSAVGFGREDRPAQGAALHPEDIRRCPRNHGSPAPARERLCAWQPGAGLGDPAGA